MIENILWLIVPPLIFIGGVAGFVYAALQLALIFLPVGVVETEGQLIESRTTYEHDYDVDSNTPRRNLVKDWTIRFRDAQGQSRTFQVRNWYAHASLPGRIKVRYFPSAPNIARSKETVLFTLVEAAAFGLVMFVMWVMATVTWQWLFREWVPMLLGFLGVK